MSLGTAFGLEVDYVDVDQLVGEHKVELTNGEMQDLQQQQQQQTYAEASS